MRASASISPSVAGLGPTCLTSSSVRMSKVLKGTLVSSRIPINCLEKPHLGSGGQVFRGCKVLRTSCKVQGAENLVQCPRCKGHCTWCNVQMGLVCHHTCRVALHKDHDRAGVCEGGESLVQGHLGGQHEIVMGINRVIVTERGDTLVGSMRESW